MVESKQDELEKDGWTRRFSASEPRLSESIEMYKELGFEVHLEPFHPEGDEECTACLEGLEHEVKVIYTKPKKEG